MAPYCIILCILQSGKNTKPVKRETRLVPGLCLGGTVDYRGTEGIFFVPVNCCTSWLRWRLHDCKIYKSKTLNDEFYYMSITLSVKNLN